MQEAGGAERADRPDSVAFVRFRVGGFPLAVEAGHVARVAPVPGRTRLPGSAPAVAGLAHVAGAPTALVSLADRLDVEPADEDRVVVVRSGAGRVGLLADETGGLSTAPADALTVPGEADDLFLGQVTTDPLFRAVVAFEDARAYALSPPTAAALAAPGTPATGDTADDDPNDAATTGGAGP